MENSKKNRREINYPTRVDKVTFKSRLTRNIKAIITVIVAIIVLIPVFWMGATSLKTRADAVAAPLKFSSSRAWKDLLVFSLSVAR